MSRGPVVQRLYGIRVRTPWRVRGVPACASDEWDVELAEGESALFDDARMRVPVSQADAWAQSAALPGGACYCRWNGVLEFVVSADARRVDARALDGANTEALLAYVLVQALAFALVRMGREPLHATAVSAGSKAVALLGPSGAGKSTLGAALVREGCRLLADDMLVLTHTDGDFVVEPGPPRIKLYRPVAVRLLRRGFRSVRMNPWTEKLIIPLDRRQADQRRPRLEALYLLDYRRDRSRRAPLIRAVRPARAFKRILSVTAGLWPDDPDRLRQQFSFVTTLLGRVPVLTLSYTRDVTGIDRVAEAVLQDLHRTTAP